MAWVYDLALRLAFPNYACVVLRNYGLDIVHAAITDLDCVPVENLCSLCRLGGKLTFIEDFSVEGPTTESNFREKKETWRNVNFVNKVRRNN